MKIGVLSDTHDNIPTIEKAVAFFNKERCDFIFHAGDFVAPFTIPVLQKLLCRWQGVFGNNDGEHNGLSRVSHGNISEGPLWIRMHNRAIVVVHDVHSIIPNHEKADLIIFGHTHKPEITKQDNTLFVNPGECGGWLTGKSTVAVVELDSLSAKIIDL